MTDETVVRMPKLADTLVEGTLGRWLKHVGERVVQGEPLASVETDKVTTDIPAPSAGMLLEVMVSEGQTVAVETPIARIGEERAERTAATETPPRPTPVAARLLAEHGVSASQVPTHKGRLRKDDVLTFVQARRPLSSMRRAIADHMTKAFQSIPHGQTVMEADLSGLVAWREANKARFQQEEGAALTFTVLFVYALARQLATALDNQDGQVDIGVAVALDDGLIVPVLRGADRLSLSDVARGVTDLASRARASQLQPGDMQGARMTLTNVGSFGNLTASPIIPLGQLGILGTGLVERRPLPAPDYGIRLGWRCFLSFVFDRRVFNDLEADHFLRGVIDRLLSVPPQ